MSHDARIAVAELPKEKCLFIRCEGRCTMGICPTLKTAIADCTKRPYEHVYLDLSDTEFIDSTFTGFLLALRPGRSNPNAPQVHLVAPSPNVMRTLETMQVLRVLDTVDALPIGDFAWKPLTSQPLDPAKAGEIIIDAHEKLIEADERNREKFGRVVETFREDHQRREDTND